MILDVEPEDDEDEEEEEEEEDDNESGLGDGQERWVADQASDDTIAEWPATCPSLNPQQKCCTASFTNGLYARVLEFSR
ncbi:hypothetical protein J3459_008192 [Metarhizium acridum]|nr:hypothetical protein J3459_008192 [Metarhizium acridum]